MIGRANIPRLRGAGVSHGPTAPHLPVVARALGGPDPTGSLSRTHAEIEHHVARLDRLLVEIGSGPATPDDVIELRRSLYGLYAVLRLHNAQEEESAFSLLIDPPP